MRVRGICTGVVVLAAMTMIASASSGTARLEVAQLDLSSNRAIHSYLRSIGVDPDGVVIQRGSRNYAGPRCPGKRWTCTQATRVVQIGTGSARGLQSVAAGSSVNSFDCTATDCVAVQTGATNAANWKQSGTDLRATLTQTGTSNTANIIQQSSQRGPLLQSATARISLNQSAPNGGSNSASLNQQIIQQSNLRSAGDIVQDFKGDQFIEVDQSGLNGASNSANTSQTVTQDAVARTTGATSAVTQSENVSDLDATTPRTIGARIDQDSDTGTNSVVRRQKLTMNAVATAINGGITQTQGSVDGGIDASSDADGIHQSSAGVSTSSNTLDESLNVSASTTGQVSQSQFGPMDCCSGQETNENNRFDVDETSTLVASDPNAVQKNTITGTASSSGTVSVDQTLTIDGQTETQSCTSSDCTNTLTESSASGGTNFSSTDVAYFGFGGMRGIGTGSIDVAGVTGTVTKALLYWNGPTNSSDPAANASVTFNGTPIRGVNIGFADDNCWDLLNSQSYRADVTSLVSGNGTYSLANFTKLPDADVNGASLVVFFNDGNTANDRNVALFNGNDSNIESSFDPAGWDETIRGVDFPGGSASLDLIVSDGQTFLDDALVLNGSDLAPAGPIFQGDSVPAGSGGAGNGSLWDVKSFGITSFLSPGTNTLHLTTGTFEDCLSLVVAAANVPAAAPIG
jgi:hypothetical protein